MNIDLIHVEPKYSRFNRLTYVEGLNHLEGESEDGYERLKELIKGVFTAEPNGESHIITTCFYYSLFIGFFFGGLRDQRTRFEAFKRQHNEYQFQGKTDASRKLVDMLFLHSLRGGSLYACKLSFLSTSFCTCFLGSLVYRNDLRVTDVALSSAAFGALYKFNMGPKGMLSAAIVTGVLTSFSVLLAKLSLFSMGKNVLEFRAWCNDANIKRMANEEVKKKNLLEKERKFFSFFSTKLSQLMHHDKITKKFNNEEAVQEKSQT